MAARPDPRGPRYHPRQRRTGACGGALLGHSSESASAAGRRARTNWRAAAASATGSSGRRRGCEKKPPLPVLAPSTPPGISRSRPSLMYSVLCVPSKSGMTKPLNPSGKW